MPPPPPPLDPPTRSAALLLVAVSCGGAAETGNTQRDRDGSDPAKLEPDTPDAATTNGAVPDVEAAEATQNGAPGAGTTPPGTASNDGSSGDPTTGAASTGTASTGTASSGDVSSGTGSTPAGGPGAPTQSVNEIIVPDTQSCSPSNIGTDEESIALMQPFVQRHSDFARRTIYSWTTAEQVDELRADPTLLTRSATSEGERGRAADLMAYYADTDPVAELLEQPQYQNRRFGWSNPWATLLGWEGESYGDQLLQITLREDAWVARLMVNYDGLEWAFADLKGNEISQQEVLDNPERLAAVYFADGRDGGCGTLFIDGSTFREYFIVNEAMVESWQAHTPEIRDELARGISAIESLLGELRNAECELFVGCQLPLLSEYWNDDSRELDGMAALYMASLAFQTPHYEPYEQNLVKLLAALEAVPIEDDALEHDYPERNEADGSTR